MDSNLAVPVTSGVASRMKASRRRVALAKASWLSQPRVLLFFIAIGAKLLASSLSGAGFVLASEGLSGLGTACWLGWFSLLFVIALPQCDAVLRRYVPQLRVAALAVVASVIVFGGMEAGALASHQTQSRASNFPGSIPKLFVSFYSMVGYNDATALTAQAAHNLITGENPYQASDIVTALTPVKDSADKVTPLRQGDFSQVFPYPTDQQLEAVWAKATSAPGPVPAELETKFDYPAGSFLIPAPFVWVGLQDLRLIYLILVLASLAFTFLVIKGGARLVFALAVVASLELWNCVVTGDTGLAYFAFLLPAWVLLRRNAWVSALLLGIAVGTKQQAWLFVPFFLIAIYYSWDFKKVCFSALMVLAVFLAMNGAFIWQNFGLWLSSVLAPVADKMFPLGVGVITIVTGGLADIRSSAPFVAVEVSAFIAGAVWYYRTYKRYPNAGPLLAVIPLFFGWRSLWNYFYYADIMMLAAILADEGPFARPRLRHETA